MKRYNPYQNGNESENVISQDALTFITETTMIVGNAKLHPTYSNIMIAQRRIEELERNDMPPELCESLHSLYSPKLKSRGLTKYLVGLRLYIKRHMGI